MKPNTADWQSGTALLQPGKRDVNMQPCQLQQRTGRGLTRSAPDSDSEDLEAEVSLTYSYLPCLLFPEPSLQAPVFALSLLFGKEILVNIS